MPRKSFASMHCSIARTFAALGDAWSALILRDVFVGLRRFEDLKEDLGISRKVLSERLDHLVASGILERRPYQERPLRTELILTRQGEELIPPILALLAWGDRYPSAASGPPALIVHKGHLARARVSCEVCGETLHARDLVVRAGPGGKWGPGTKKIAELFRAQAEAPPTPRRSPRRRPSRRPAPRPS